MALLAQGERKVRLNHPPAILALGSESTQSQRTCLIPYPSLTFPTMHYSSLLYLLVTCRQFLVCQDWRESSGCVEVNATVRSFPRKTVIVGTNPPDLVFSFNHEVLASEGIQIQARKGGIFARFQGHESVGEGAMAEGILE